MSETHTTATGTEQMTPSQPQPMSQPISRPAMVWEVLRDQRKTLLAAVALVVASFWIAGPLGEWRLAGCIAGGVVLGVVNHVATEYWLLRIIRSGEQPTRGRLAVSTVIRLAVLSVVAIGVAVAFWPDGIGLLLGLAIFRLIALVMTGIPLLRQLKKELNHP